MADPTYDVMIVGAGPAGSSAAYELATAGQRVLVVDKAEFPRDKPCGGGLTPKTLKRMRFDISGVVERECQAMEVTYNLERATRLPEGGVLCAMTQRERFDALLLKKAREAGAAFEVAEVMGVEQDNGRVVVLCKDGRSFEAKWLVAADGAKSPIRRMLHKHTVVRQAFGLEGKAEMRDGKPLISFDFFVVPWGYGWVFPKGDHMNVGICTFNRNVKISKAELNAYATRKLGHAELREVVGYPLGLGVGNGRKALGRILFAGDAGGTVEPLLGEGIHNAVMSGQMAAKAIAGNGAPVKVRWAYWWHMLPQMSEMVSCYNLHMLFYRYPRMGFWWMTRRRIMRWMVEGFVVGKTMDKLVLRSLWLGLTGAR